VRFVDGSYERADSF